MNITVQDCFGKKGFSNVRVTKGSGDQGIDIIAHAGGKKIGVQCKYYSKPVGNSAVQEAYAGARFYNCDVAAVMTNSNFTESAQALAAATGVLMWGNNKIQYNTIPWHFKLQRVFGFLVFGFGILSLILWIDSYRHSDQLDFVALFLIAMILIAGGSSIMQYRNKNLWRYGFVCYIVLAVLLLPEILSGSNVIPVIIFFITMATISALLSGMKITNKLREYFDQQKSNTFGTSIDNNIRNGTEMHNVESPGVPCPKRKRDVSQGKLSESELLSFAKMCNAQMEHDEEMERYKDLK